MTSATVGASLGDSSAGLGIFGPDRTLARDLTSGAALYCFCRRAFGRQEGGTIRYLWIVLSIGLVGPSAYAEALREVCLPGTDNGEGLTLRVDTTGSVHLSRIALASGNLSYTNIGPDDRVESEMVARRVSVFPADPVRSTDLRLREGEPFVCYRNARSGRLQVSSRVNGQWTHEDAVVAPDLLDACALFWSEGELRLLFSSSRGVQEARRQIDGSWRVHDVDLTEGAGSGLALAHFQDGRVVAAYRSGAEGHLRVATRPRQGEWVTEVVEFAVPSGESIRVVGAPGGHVWITHGVTGAQGSDAGLVLTYGIPGQFESVYLRNEYIGGSIGAARLAGQQLGVVARELRRSAVFGDFDGLRYYASLPAFIDYRYLAQHDSDEIRHTYRNIDLASDPFGLPVGALVIDRAPSRGDRGGAPVCVLLPVDRDRDRLPDRVEGWLGSDPDNEDTDGDGVSDGEAALAGRHPVSGEALPEGVLLGAPEGPAFTPPDGQDGGASPPQDGGGLADAGLVTALDAGSDVPLDIGVAREDGLVPDQDAGTQLPVGRDAAPVVAQDSRMIDGRPEGTAGEQAGQSPDGGCSQSDGGSGEGVVLFMVFCLWGVTRKRINFSIAPSKGRLI